MGGSAALPALGWGAAALVLGALSIAAMSGELRVPRQIAISSDVQAEPMFGLSHRSATAALARCEAHLARPAVRVRPTTEWHAALNTCRTQAQLVVERWPTDARAWLLVATTSEALDETATSSDALRRSQLLSPAVQWLAERRLLLANADAGDYSYDADVLTLLDSDIGARVLAGFWVAGDDARRARIETAAEQAAPALQQRLLDKIRERAAASS